MRNILLNSSENISVSLMIFHIVCLINCFSTIRINTIFSIKRSSSESKSPDTIILFVSSYDTCTTRNKNNTLKCYFNDLKTLWEYFPAIAIMIVLYIFFLNFGKPLTRVCMHVSISTIAKEAAEIDF